MEISRGKPFHFHCVSSSVPEQSSMWALDQYTAIFLTKGKSIEMNTYSFDL